ncbi:proteasome regulatory particle base subunit rpn10 [Rhizina undulata]
MVLEATMIIIDNSESSRNGDYTPTRFEAQEDAVSLIFSAKTAANPESSVGLMTMGGKGPEVLVTLTTDFGKILTGLHDTKIKGGTHLATGIQVAGLALKHRQNKSQRQRIIAFVGSPITEDEKTLVKLAKKMKKNNIAVDFVNFGEIDSNIQKLQAFIDAINSSDNSHLVTIPPGPYLLTDQLVGTPIMGEEGGMGGAGADGSLGGGDASQFEFGVDPTLDPDLALALRMSMEEEKARLAKEQKDKEEAEKKKEGEASGSLEGIKEEDENTPLLKKDGKKDDDKMDTA